MNFSIFFKFAFEKFLGIHFTELVYIHTEKKDLIDSIKWEY